MPISSKNERHNFALMSLILAEMVNSLIEEM